MSPQLAVSVIALPLHYKGRLLAKEAPIGTGDWDGAAERS